MSINKLDRAYWAKVFANTEFDSGGSLRSWANIYACDRFGLAKELKKTMEPLFIIMEEVLNDG